MLAVASKHGLINYPVHIKIDTGMHRLGFMPEDVDILAERIKNQECVRVISVFSHLAASEDPALDNFTHKQVEVFLKAVRTDQVKQLDILFCVIFLILPELHVFLNISLKWYVRGLECMELVILKVLILKLQDVSRQGSHR